MRVCVEIMVSRNFKKINFRLMQKQIGAKLFTKTNSYTKPIWDLGFGIWDFFSHRVLFIPQEHPPQPPPQPELHELPELQLDPDESLEPEEQPLPQPAPHEPELVAACWFARENALLYSL